MNLPALARPDLKVIAPSTPGALKDPMSSAHLPTDVLLLRLRCHRPDVATLAQGLATAPICLELEIELCRSAWSAASGIAYLYLRLTHRTALSLGTLAPQFDALYRSTQLKVSRLAMMADIPGASHGQQAAVHYAVEMTPEASWEVELQNWYDSEHLPGLARVQGCVHAQRYWNYDEGPQSLACYDLLDEKVVGSEAWLAVRNTAWSSRMRPRFTDTIRTTFTLQS